MTDDTHPLAAQYVSDLKAEAKVLPRQQRGELIAQIENHLAEAVRSSTSEAEIRNLIDDLGSPHEVVEAARPTEPTRRHTGVMALTLGIVALVAALLPVLGLVIAIPCATVAIVLGRRARHEAKAAGTTDTAATAGVVLGVVALLIPVFLVLLLVAGDPVVEDSEPTTVDGVPTTAP